MSIPQTILAIVDDYAGAPVGTICRDWEPNRDVSTAAWIKVGADHWEGTGGDGRITDEEMAASASFVAYRPA